MRSSETGFASLAVSEAGFVSLANARRSSPAAANRMPSAPIEKRTLRPTTVTPPRSRELTAGFRDAGLLLDRLEGRLFRDADVVRARNGHLQAVASCRPLRERKRPALHRALAVLEADRLADQRGRRAVGHLPEEPVGRPERGPVAAGEA